MKKFLKVFCLLVSIALCNTYMSCLQTTKNVVDDGFTSSYRVKATFSKEPIKVRVALIDRDHHQENSDQPTILAVVDEVEIQPSEVVEIRFNVKDYDEFNSFDYSPVFRIFHSNGYYGWDMPLNTAKNKTVVLTLKSDGNFENNRTEVRYKPLSQNN